MPKYIVCPIDAEPEYYNEICAFDEEEAVAEFAQKEYNEIEPFDEGEYSVYVKFPSNIIHMGDYKAIAEYDVRFHVSQK